MAAAGRSGPKGYTDRELVLAFQAGDPDAYDEMFRRYHARVLRVCTRMLGNPQDAEEAAQETFLKAYQALPRFNGDFQLGAWLSRIAANVSVDNLRARSRSNLVGLPSEDEALAPDQGPEDVVVGQHPRLVEAIRRVQPLHAQALALRTLEGLSHQEIAQRLALSPTQVKALLHRARTSLRRAWEKAEGWAFAPFFALQSVIDRRGEASQASSNLVTIGPSLSPVVAERVAATAIIVVVALGGFPTASDTAPSQPRAGAVGVEAGDSARPRKPARVRRAARPEAARRAPAAQPAEAAAPATESLALEGQVPALEAHGQLQGEAEMRQDDAAPTDKLSDAAPKEARPAVKAVRKVLKRLPTRP